MKKLILIVLLCLATEIFSASVAQYKYFSDAKKLYAQSEYQKSAELFETLEKSFKGTELITSNYYAYYYAIALYSSGDLDNAIYYMQRATYTLSNSEDRKVFYVKKKYFLSRFYLEKGNVNSAKEILKTLINTKYTKETASYIDYAFATMKKDFGVDYKKIFELYMDGNPSYFKNFSDKDLETAAELFIENSDPNTSLKIYKYLYEKNTKSEKFALKYLQLLYAQKKFDELFAVTEKMKTILVLPEISYYKGKYFVDKNNMSEAIFYLNNALVSYETSKGKSFTFDARENLFNIYYSMLDYNNIFKLSKKDYELSRNEESIIIMSKFRTGKFNDAFLEAQQFVQKFPYSFDGNYIFLLLRKLKFEITQASLEKIEEFSEQTALKIGVNILGLIKYRSVSFNFDMMKEMNDNAEVTKLFQIAQLGDKELLQMGIFNTRMLIADKLKEKAIITEIYASGNFFAEAYENSWKDGPIFFRYPDMLQYAFPKYYQNLVVASSLKYNVPTYKIYTVMAIKNKFRFLEPDREINEIARYLSILTKKYKNNDVASLLELLYGEIVVKKIEFLHNYDFYIERIIDPNLKGRVEDVMMTYLFYKASN
ncbi:MAG: hypothetical protein ACRCSK_08975 [Fusobacteriaceae bacterium]